MDKPFQPAEEAIQAGDVRTLEQLLQDDSSLATTRSSSGHPTLLQCAVLAKDAPNNTELIKVLIDSGSELDDPLVAAAGPDNLPAIEVLLDAGARMERRDWSALEEALYFCSTDTLQLLIARGAVIDNLRKAAGVGIWVR